jgi:hypothetical protein
VCFKQYTGDRSRGTAQTKRCRFEATIPKTKSTPFAFLFAAQAEEYLFAAQAEEYNVEEQLNQ